MRRLAPFALLAALTALTVSWPSVPAFAACAQAADGRCVDPGAACHPPADGRCSTLAAASLSKLSHACRCASPRQSASHETRPAQGECRQTCNAREITCESNARNFTQRNNCVSRYTTCNRHCS